MSSPEIRLQKIMGIRYQDYDFLGFAFGGDGCSYIWGEWRLTKIVGRSRDVGRPRDGGRQRTSLNGLNGLLSTDFGELIERIMAAV